MKNEKQPCSINPEMNLQFFFAQHYTGMCTNGTTICSHMHVAYTVLILEYMVSGKKHNAHTATELTWLGF